MDMNGILFKTFFCLLLSSQLGAQTFIHLNDIESEFNRINRRYVVLLKTIEHKSDLSISYDSCIVNILYKIVDAKVVSKEIPRVNCFCKNGGIKSFGNSRNIKESDVTPLINEMLSKISRAIHSPIIIIKEENPIGGEFYLGGITVIFKT